MHACKEFLSFGMTSQSTMLRDDGEVLAAWHSHLGVGYRKAYGDVHTAKTRLYTATPGGGCITL